MVLMRALAMSFTAFTLVGLSLILCTPFVAATLWLLEGWENRHGERDTEQARQDEARKS